MTNTRRTTRRCRASSTPCRAKERSSSLLTKQKTRPRKKMPSAAWISPLPRSFFTKTPWKNKKAKDDAKDKDKKKDEEPKLKKDAKPAVTLIFGKTEKDTVYVKRVTQDGTVSRFTVPKAIMEKVLPAEGVLAFFDTALPSF